MARKSRRGEASEPRELTEADLIAMDFGGDELDEELEADALPAAPAAPRAEEPSQPPQELVDLGAPPKEPAKAQQWLYQAMLISARLAMLDTTISQATRRRELRTIAASAAKLFPDAERARILEEINRDRSELDRKKRARVGAKVEKRPLLGKLIPMRGNGSAPS